MFENAESFRSNGIRIAPEKDIQQKILQLVLAELAKAVARPEAAAKDDAKKNLGKAPGKVIGEKRPSQKNIKETKSKAEEQKSKLVDVLEALDKLGEDENPEDDLDGHVKAKKGGKSGLNYGEMLHQLQYQNLLEQYKRFLNAYLKEYYSTPSHIVAEQAYYDWSGKEKKKKVFERGEEVMGHSEVRDIVLRKRMNWVMGSMHNYISPDEEERYKFWKLFNKFNYVMAEGCMFHL